MSLDSLVDSTKLGSDLTSIANAIRSKSNSSALLSFPNGMVAAINEIPTGVQEISIKLYSSIMAVFVTSTNPVSSTFGQLDIKPFLDYKITLSSLTPTGSVKYRQNGSVSPSSTFTGYTIQFQTIQVGYTYVDTDGSSKAGSTPFTSSMNGKKIEQILNDIKDATVYTSISDPYLKTTSTKTSGSYPGSQANQYPYFTSGSPAIRDATTVVSLTL